MVVATLAVETFIQCPTHSVSNVQDVGLQIIIDNCKVSKSQIM